MAISKTRGTKMTTADIIARMDTATLVCLTLGLYVGGQVAWDRLSHWWAGRGIDYNVTWPEVKGLPIECSEIDWGKTPEYRFEIDAADEGWPTTITVHETRKGEPT